MKDGANLGSIREHKVDKSATSRYHRLVEDFDQDATDSLWLDILAEEAEDDATANGGTPADDSEPECIEFFCFSERVEDIRFGHLSDEADGGFAEYIRDIGGFVDFVNAIGTTGADAADLAQLAGSIIDEQLGARPSVTTMPVFYFCRSETPDGEIELAAQPYLPNFGWDTSVETEFDISGTLVNHRDRLFAQAMGRRPQVQSIPPVELGYTFVKLPIWLWLVDPFVGAEVHTTSGVETTRLASRAVLLDVTWTGAGEPFTCTLDQMKEFVHGTSDLRTETSECTHTFTELVDYTLSASARYLMQSQTSYRGNTDNAWPDAPWIDYADPALRYFTVTGSTQQLSVHNIVSVNVPIENSGD